MIMSNISKITYIDLMKQIPGFTVSWIYPVFHILKLFLKNQFLTLPISLLKNDAMKNG